MGLRAGWASGSIQLIAEDPDVSLACAIERPGHPRLGEDAGSLAGIAPLGVTLSPLGELTAKPDV